MSSLLTNNASMIALQTLTQTSKDMQSTQNQIATGLKISSASDNAAYWSISTTMKSDNSALSTVTDALNLGSSLIDVATNAMDTANTLVNQIKTQVVAAQQPGVDKTAIQAQISSLQAQLKSVAQSAVFSGQNWMSVDSDKTANPGYSGTAGIVASYSKDQTGAVNVGTINVNVDAIKLFDSNAAAGTTPAAPASPIPSGLIDGQRDLTTGKLYTAPATAPATPPLTASIFTLDVTKAGQVDSTGAATSPTLSQLAKVADQAVADITSAEAGLGAIKTRVSTQQTFISKLSDSITSGIGSLVDADMNKESTKLQALQVQQQLGVQSLSIANQNTQLILKLFG